MKIKPGRTALTLVLLFRSGPYTVRIPVTVARR